MEPSQSDMVVIYFRFFHGSNLEIKLTADLYEMESNNKRLPLLSDSKSYGHWFKLIHIWRKFTNLEPEKQGLAIVLSYEGEAQDKTGF